MLLGAHESVAGGLHTAFERATVDGCRALQIFTKNGNQWKEPELLPEQIAAFRAARTKAFGAAPVVMAHTSYLINLAADDREVLARSKDALAAEVLRSSALGVDFCVLHPGAHLGFGEDEGLVRVARALDEVHARTEGATCKILLENTAGQGTCVGHRFEHLARIFAETKHPERLGVCIDTQHAYAAGYDLASPEGYARAVEELDRAVGLANVRGFHLNDSKKPLGSRVDRHEHVGEGNLGLPLFWRLANDARFANVPAVIETEPRSKETPYKEEVALLRSLVGAPEPPSKPFALELSPAQGDDAPKKKPRAPRR